MKFDEQGRRITSNTQPRFITKNKKRIAIVGSSLRKGMKPSRVESYNMIESILKKNGCDANNCIIVSGHSPAGGIDIWAENIAKEKNIPTNIYYSKGYSGQAFTERNKKIANNSDMLYNIVVKSPNSYCNYHKTYGHQQSGGCMTEMMAQREGIRTNLELVNIEPFPFSTFLL